MIVLAVFVILTLFILREASASQAVDTASGLDQSFVAGYSQRSFAEDFHTKETYGVAPVKKMAADVWKIHSTFKMLTLYDSNILNKRNDLTDDLVYTYSPSIAIDRQGSYNFLQFFYNLNYTKYVENSKLSHLNNGYGFNARYYKNRWSIVFTNSFKPNTTIATGQRTELDSGGTKRAIMLSYNSALDLKYQLSPKTTLSYSQNYDLFYLPTSENSEAVHGFSTHTYTMSPRITYSVTPKTRVFASYTAQDVNFIEEGDSSSWITTLSVGASGQLTERTRMDIEMGFKDQKYHNTLLRPALNGYVVKAALNRKFTQKIFGTISMTKDIWGAFDSLEGQDPKVDSIFYGMNLSWKATAHINLNGSAGYGLVDRRGLITLVDPENPFLFFTREQRDDRLDWGISLDWTPREYMNFSIAYEEVNNNSSFKDFESEKRKIAARTNFKF